MRLFIAEKPSLARAIADNFTSRSDKTGFIEVAGGDIVSWCYGHLLESLKPEEYDPKWASWRLDTLPIIVPEWRLKPRPDAAKQLATLGGLIKQATLVVNAGDPDREGQLLVDEVLDHFKWKGKTLRLLLNATDRESVKKALQSMRSNDEFKNLSMAALCRSKADWIVGMNLTRAATKTFGHDKTVSVGRVQTPTLALVVRRDLEIENFKPATFYKLVAKVQTPQGLLSLEHAPKEGRIFDKKVATAIANALKGTQVALQLTKKKCREHPPLPYMLSTFQADAEEKLNMGAKDALDALQSLYESQLTSYPRTDHQMLPPEQAAHALKIAESVMSNGLLPEAKALRSVMKPSPRVYGLPKEAEHHGVVPTGKKPPVDMASKLFKAYELVCRRFILGLLPDYEYEETTISFVYKERADAGREFSCSGEVPINNSQLQSWRVLEPKKTQALVLNGSPDSGKVIDVEIVPGKTTPPKHYTEASLIADMRSVAKYVTDEKLKAILKETSGIGTAATQANIIETLKNRKMIEITRKKLISTPFGRDIIAKMPAALTEPGITAAWEDALTQISQGSYRADLFMQRIESFVVAQIDKLVQKRSSSSPA